MGTLIKNIPVSGFPTELQDAANHALSSGNPHGTDATQILLSDGSASIEEVLTGLSQNQGLAEAGNVTYTPDEFLVDNPYSVDGTGTTSVADALTSIGGYASSILSDLVDHRDEGRESAHQIENIEGLSEALAAKAGLDGLTASSVTVSLTGSGYFVDDVINGGNNKVQDAINVLDTALFTTHMDIADHRETSTPDAHLIGNIMGLQDALDGKADLVSGKIPSSMLPSYVDDVEEYANLASFPSEGESGKLYVALDSNLVYRWSGSAYVAIAAGSGNLVLGETDTTAYRGDRGAVAYAHTSAEGNVHNLPDASTSGSGLMTTAMVTQLADLGLGTAGSNALAQAIVSLQAQVTALEAVVVTYSGE